MRILKVAKVEDCFDGSAVYRYEFESAWTRKAILRLREFGEVQYFPDFPKPYFRVHQPEGVILQGLEGDSCCRVALPRHQRDELRRNWEDFVTDESMERTTHGTETSQTL